MFKLYYAPDTCSLATMIALEEAGVGYETVRIDFSIRQQQSPDFVKINPKARVPALETARGVLTETPAMLAFVAQSFPTAKLAPLDDAFAFARVQEFNSYICSSLHVSHAHRMRGHRWVDPEDKAAIAAMQRAVPDRMTTSYALIEQTMITGPWVMGERYTICDGYLFTLAQWLEEDGVDPARVPGITAHRARVAERPAVNRALAREAA